MLRLGSFGDEVKQLQENLNKLGCNLKLDGVFGFNTLHEVQKFQLKNNLVVDGVVGPKTLSKIEALLKPSSEVVRETVAGIDVYHGDLVNSWDDVKKAGIKFVFIKATEGVKYKDPMFQSRWSILKNLGFIRGAYHFFRPNKNPIVQAQLFVDTVGALDEMDLPLVLDWEVNDDTSFKSDKEAAMRFLFKVEELTNKRPIIYTSPSFASELYLEIDFFRYSLWIAHYRAKKPRIPQPWTNWTFWQTAEDASVMGVSGDCDFNLFNGSLDDLNKFIKDSNI